MITIQKENKVLQIRNQQKSSINYHLYNLLLNSQCMHIVKSEGPASVAQLDALSDWKPGGRGFNPRQGRQHSFVEIDREIFSTVILSLPLIQDGSCQFPK